MPPTRCLAASLLATTLLLSSTSPAIAQEAPPRWTIQVDPLTTALGFLHVQVERALGEHASVYLGPSVRLFDPLEEKPGRYWGAGGELGVRVFPWGGAPRGGWVQARGVLARLRTEENGGATALGGYASVLGGHTWILGGRWVLAAGLGVQYIHYRVGDLGSARVLPAAHTTLGVAFLPSPPLPRVCSVSSALEHRLDVCDSDPVSEQNEGVPDAATPSPGSVRLRWLKIKRYRNVRPNTELRFDDTRNILLGRNGSGKTTLLRLLAAVISSQFRLLEDPYELEYEIEINGVMLLIRAWSEEPKRRPLTDLGDSLVTGALPGRELIRRFRVSFQSSSGQPFAVEVDPRGGRVEVGGEEDRTWEGAWGEEASSLERAIGLVLFAVRVPEEVRTLAINLSPISAAIGVGVRRFDESLDTFRDLTGSMSQEGVLAPPHLVGVRTVGQEERRVLIPFGTAGKLWKRYISSPPIFQPEDMEVEISSSDPLGLLTESLGVDRFKMKIRFVEKLLESESIENWYYRTLKFQFTRRGTIFSHDALSYGQKRLLAFLYYLSINEYIVIADELVNGLHHEWIELCLNQLGERQAFLTSQNPLLLDYLPPGSVEQAQRRYILCRSEPTENGEDLIWENMPEVEAERFFRAYTVGIQQVGEVLLSKGLW